MIKCQDARICTQLQICNWYIYFEIIYIKIFKSWSRRLNLKEWLTIFMHIYIKIYMVHVLGTFARKYIF